MQKIQAYIAITLFSTLPMSNLQAMQGMEEDETQVFGDLSDEGEDLSESVVVNLDKKPADQKAWQKDDYEAPTSDEHVPFLKKIIEGKPHTRPPLPEKYGMPENVELPYSVFAEADNLYDSYGVPDEEVIEHDLSTTQEYNMPSKNKNFVGNREESTVSSRYSLKDEAARQHNIKKKRKMDKTQYVPMPKMSEKLTKSERSLKDEADYQRHVKKQRALAKTQYSLMLRVPEMSESTHSHQKKMHRTHRPIEPAKVKDRVKYFEQMAESHK